MRIAFIVPAPFDLLTGGYEYDRQMVSAWRHDGHQVDMHEIAGQHPLPDAASRASANAIWAGLPDDAVVVIDNLGLASFANLGDAFAQRRVVVLDHHPTGLETGLDAATSAALLQAEQDLLPKASHVVTPSRVIADTLAADFSVPLSRITVVEPGTAPAPRSAGSGTATVNILSIGSLIARKGHDVLLRALARLSDLDWHLTIAGSPVHDPDTAHALMALPASLGIAERVTFLGEMRDEALVELWGTADIFALATHYEGYGMVIAEALKRGLPIAVCNGGAAAAFVTTESAVVCAPGDVDQLSKALRRVIYDPNLRRSMGEAAWLSGQTLPDWPQQAAAFAKIFT